MWDFAREHGYVIVSKDEDFANLQTLLGYPPRLVLLRMGNCNNQKVLESLLAARSQLAELLSQEGIGMVEIA